jgi:hypothetical protein
MIEITARDWWHLLERYRLAALSWNPQQSVSSLFIWEHQLLSRPE